MGAIKKCRSTQKVTQGSAAQKEFVIYHLAVANLLHVLSLLRR
jgi:hypothetical protein